MKKKATNPKTGETREFTRIWLNKKRGLVSEADSMPRGEGWIAQWSSDADWSAKRFRRVFRDRRARKKKEAQKDDINRELSKMLSPFLGGR